MRTVIACKNHNIIDNAQGNAIITSFFCVPPMDCGTPGESITVASSLGAELQAQLLAEHLEAHYSEMERGKYLDGELFTRHGRENCSHHLEGNNAITVIATHDADAIWDALCTLGYVGNRWGIKSHFLVNPYFGYSRSDKEQSSERPFRELTRGIDMMAHLTIPNHNLTGAVFVDLHNSNLRNHAQCPTKNVKTTTLAVREIISLITRLGLSESDFSLLAPDKGSSDRVSQIADGVSAEIEAPVSMVWTDKHRIDGETVRITDAFWPFRKFHGKNYQLTPKQRKRLKLLIGCDDLISTGGSFIEAFSYVMKKSAMNTLENGVFMATHLLPEGDCTRELQEKARARIIDFFQKADLNGLLIGGNTYPGTPEVGEHEREGYRLRIFDVIPLIVEELKKPLSGALRKEGHSFTEKPSA